MADGLQPTGINLRAAGFNDYIKKLQQIDKAQREVFEKQFKGTDLSYRQLISASKAYERQLQQEARAAERAAERARRAEIRRAQDTLKEREKQLAGGGGRGGFQGGLTDAVGAGIAGFFTAQTLTATVELAKQGAAFEAQQKALSNLAAGYELTNSQITAAMRRGSQGVLSNSAIMEAANKTLLLEVAKTPEEFERVTRNAIVLGRALGIDAPDAIDQFTSALGRKSLLILDNFGIKAAQVNEQLDRLGQERFGVGISGLSAAQKDALFIEAALAAADERVQSIGENADSAAVQFDRIAAASENLKTTLGLVVKDLDQSLGISEAIADTLGALTGTVEDVRVFSGLFDPSTQEQIIAAENRLKQLQELRDDLAGRQAGPLAGLFGFDAEAQAEQLAEFDRAIEQETARIEGLQQQELEAAQATGLWGESIDDATSALEDNEDALRNQEQAIKQQQQTVRQAEAIALNFARAQEDAARNLARSQARLDEQQAKAREKLFVDQQKQLDKFEAQAAKDRIKQQANLAKQEEKLRKDSAQKEIDESRQLQRQLKNDLDRFNLDRLQSSRRFQLSDRRLRAEGDILGLQQLREDFALSEQEARENFGLNRSQQQDEANERQRLQQRDNEAQIEELRAGLAEQNAEFEASLDERRAELLTSFDEQEADLRQSQQEQRDDLLRSYQEQLEDLNFNRQRQLEDLGRSLIEQEGITRDGAQKIADALEEAFGVEGTADIIMNAFTERQASNFQDLFESIGESVEQAAGATSAETSPTDIRRRYPQLPSFGDGGMVDAPLGMPVPATLHGGERVLTPGQQTQIARMLAPVVPSQRLTIGGGATFKVDAPAGTSANVVNEAIMEITQSFDEAVRRLERRR